MIEVTIRNPRLEPFRSVIEEVARSVNPDDPPALGLLCNGSVPRGCSGDASDLDLCVCCDAPVTRFIRSRVGGTAVDLHYEDARWMHDARAPYDPTALFMLADAEVLWERGSLLSRHAVQATRQFHEPAPEVSTWDRFLLKIECDRRLSRLLRGLSSDTNVAFLLGGLLERTVEAALRLNRRWYLDTGQGLRDLQRACPALAERLNFAATEAAGRRNGDALKAYLCELFGEEMPLDAWDSGWVRHRT